MKESKLTGRIIYDGIRKLEVEVEELAKACDQISDDLGQDTLAYKLLDKAYNEKKTELNKVLVQQYSVTIMNPFSTFTSK